MLCTGIHNYTALLIELYTSCGRVRFMYNTNFLIGNINDIRCLALKYCDVHLETYKPLFSSKSIYSICKESQSCLKNHAPLWAF